MQNRAEMFEQRSMRFWNPRRPPSKTEFGNILDAGLDKWQTFAF